MDLPNDWDLRLLGEVVDVTKRPPTLLFDEERQVPFVPMAAIPDSALVLHDWEMRTQKEIRSGVYFEEGDVLLAKITPCLENGKQALVESLPGGWGFATTEVFPLRGRRVTGEFLALYLKTPGVREQMVSKMQGTTGRRRLPREALMQTPVPVPPVEEQREIAQVLRGVQQAKERVVEVAAAAYALKRSLASHVFSRGLEDGTEQQNTPWGVGPSTWTLRSGSDVVTETKSGTWGSESHKDGLEETLVVRGTDFDALRQRHVEALPVRHVASRSLQQRLLMGGELLVEMSGGSERKATGRVVLVPHGLGTSSRPITFGNFIKRIDLVDFVDPAFFQKHWEFLYMLGRTRPYERRTTGIRNFKLDAFLSSESFLVAPPDQQKRVVALLDAVDTKIEREHQQADALDALFNSLLHELMTGRRRLPGFGKAA